MLTEGLNDQELAQEIDTICAINLANCYESLGQTEEAIAEYERAAERARQSRDIRRTVICLCNSGDAYASLCQYQAARRNLQQALELCQQFGFHTFTGDILHNLAQIACDTDQYQDAISYARSGMQHGQEVGMPAIVATNAYTLACAYLYNADLAAGQEAVAAARQSTVPSYYHRALALTGILALWQGNCSTANESFDAALQAAANMLAQDDQNYQAYDTRAVALAGLTLTAQTARCDEALAAYLAARAINDQPGIERRAVRLLNLLISRDSDGKLTQLRRDVHQIGS